MRKFLLSLALPMMLAAPAFAIDYPAGDLTPIAHFAIGEGGIVPGSESLVTVDYSNVTSFLGQGFANGGTANQAGNLITKIVADNLTPTGAGAGSAVTQIKFSVANFNAVTVSVRARARFWNADGAGGLPGTYYSNPAAVGFSFNALAFAPGVTVVTGTIGAGAFNMPGATFWAGLCFDNNTGATGATLAQMDNMGQGLFNPPTAGSSTDQIFVTTAAGSFFPTPNPAGSTVNFSGNPIANLGWEFTTAAVPNATEPTSWGKIKSLF